MWETIKKYSSWLIVGVLVVLLMWSLFTERREPVVIEKRTTDTLIVTKTDTVTITKVETKIINQIDTTYIVVRDSIRVPIPISEYEFKKDGLFNFKVKGFDVSFISANVYPKTEYRTVTNTINTTIKEDKSALFVSGGFTVISETFVPQVSVDLSIKNKWLIEANVGVYKKQMIYGCKVGYNILNKKKK